MSRRRRNPFGEINPVIKKVGGAYFASFGCVSPNLSPVSQQELEKRQAQITELLFRAAERLAAKLGIPPDEARTKYFTQKMADGTEVEPLNFLDDLNSEEKTQFWMLQNESKDVEINAATLFMQNRLAYDLDVSEPAKVKAKQLYIVEPWFEIQKGDRFRFQSQTVIALSGYDTESKSIDVDPLNADLSPNDVGFLLNKEGGYVLGDKEWTQEDTRSLLTTSSNTQEPGQIQTIYRFYQAEIGRIVEEPKQQQEEQPNFTSNGKDSSSGSTPPLLNGQTSSGRSIVVMQPMSASDTEILATAQTS